MALPGPNPTVDLSRYSPAGFDRGASRVVEALWVLVRCLFFAPALPLPSRFRVFWLRLFGAKVGRGVVIRSGVNIHFPWRLQIGDYVWVGEQCGLLNLAPIVIGNHVCISQRAYLCTGNHNFTSPTFDLMVKPIHLESGAWIGAGGFVGPGVTVGSHAVLTAGSVATTDLQPYGIYRGNPAVKIKDRILRSPHQ
ncbi:MAG TPA: putative colanic acid biosynthesis acetyltransferase [Verrucomicrobiae bacterium]